MVFGVGSFAAGAYTAGIPVTIGIIRVVINVCMLLSRVLLAPMSLPFIALYADVVVASGVSAVARATLLAKAAVGAYRAAFGADAAAVIANSTQSWQ